MNYLIFDHISLNIHMHKLLFNIIISCLLLFTSCITIEESYSFKEDGSGSCSFVINMSQMKKIMETMSGAIEGSEPATLRAMDFNIYKDTLSKTKGITNIKTKLDNTNYQFELTYDFSSNETLNNAMNIIFESKNKVFFNYKKKDIELTHPLPQLINNELEDVSSEQTTMFLESVKYNITLNFERPIKKATTTAVKRISEKKNQLVLETNLNELINTPDKFHTRVKLK